MTPYQRENPGIAVDMRTLLQVVRAVAAFVGVIAIAMGLYCATRLFALIINTMSTPNAVQAILDGWTAAVGGDSLDLLIEGTTYPVARYLAVLVLGSATWLLAWLSLGIIMAGAKTVSWTLGDRDSIKKLLTDALARRSPPDPGRPTVIP